MGNKIKRDAIPQPSGNNPWTGSDGRAAYNALANNANAVQNATGATTAGPDIVTGGVSFVPKISGKVLMLWSSCGATSNATTAVTFLPAIGGITGPGIIAGSAGDAASFEANGAGSFIFSGLTVGTPVTAQVSFTSAAGTYNPAAGGGSISLIELPA